MIDGCDAIITAQRGFLENLAPDLEISNADLSRPFSRMPSTYLVRTPTVLVIKRECTLNSAL